MPLVTLSFDNGPHPGVTPMALQTLARYAIPATFFVLGKNIEAPEGRAAMAEAHARGHWIGNHTYHHETPLGLIEDPAASVEEIERTDALIGDYASPSPLFRPYGQGGMLDRRLLSEAAVDHLLKRRATCVTWNVVPRDWSDPYGWVDTALRQIGEQEESLVVLHDIPTGAMVHLERFIEGALALGAAFRQDFPDDCVLIREGSPTAALSAYVTRRQ
ncbi:MAG TPA: polysaccharide deacetylase family protein [Roseiarcus sp.]|jgi:peptidoglycan-N-acetylglucosamine deacetylase|nr:polysaccharide deacetylase family protein [Roseiarcus sp.]